MNKDFNYTGSIILGMHDAIVSLTGLIVGLSFAFTDSNIIVLSCIISSITASLSMGAANYLATKTTHKQHAIRAALYTCAAYIITCIILILPFVIFYNRITALLSVFILVILIIYTFNRIVYRRINKHFYEMLTICFIVSLVAFLIGEGAKIIFGI